MGLDKVPTAPNQELNLLATCEVCDAWVKEVPAGCSWTTRLLLLLLMPLR